MLCRLRVLLQISQKDLPYTSFEHFQLACVMHHSFETATRADGLSEALTLNTDLHIKKSQFASMLISFNDDDDTTQALTVSSYGFVGFHTPETRSSIRPSRVGIAIFFC